MHSKHRGFPPRRQRGQAIVWFLATAAACCCIFALVYNVGQVTNNKEQTVNAADAAALSGAMTEARVLNFVAYTNRAVIANEVAVAQLVSADSFLDYSNQIIQTLESYAQYVPIVDDFTGPVAAAAEVATMVADQGTGGLIAEADFMVKELAGAGQAAFNVGAAAANDISGQVAAANDTALLNAGVAAAAVNEVKWGAFADSSGNQEIGKQLILESRDPFSTNRGNGVVQKAVNTYLLVLGVGQEAAGILEDFVQNPLGGLGEAASKLVTGVKFKQLDKTSGVTTLDDTTDHWIAQDSTDLDQHDIHLKLSFKHPVADDVTNIPLAMAYGRADANPDSSVGDYRCDNQAALNLDPALPGMNIKNCDEAHDAANSYQWSGVPTTFLDLAKGLSKVDQCSVNNGSDGPSVPYVTAVQKAGKDTATTENLQMDTVDVPGPQGSTQTADNFWQGGLTGVSEACVFFLRPDSSDKYALRANLPRLDHVHEFASLYNPYWQARLTAPTTDWVTAVYAAIGKPGLNVATQ